MIALIIMSTVKVGYAWDIIGNHLFKFYTGVGLALLIDLHLLFFGIVGGSLFYFPIYDEYRDH